MSGARWWVEAQGRTWGPYPEARLPDFVKEGRLGPGSRVASAAEGPFAPALEMRPDLFAAPDEADASEPSEPAAASMAGSAPTAAGPSLRRLLVFTDAQEADAPGFEAALGAYGEAVPIRPGLWLLRSDTADAAALRNGLSRGLRGRGMLLVADAPAQAAWFNLDGDTDRALRRLWGAG